MIRKTRGPRKSSKAAVKKKERQDRVDRTVEEISFETGRSSLGSVLVASSAKGVVAIMVEDDPGQLLQDLEWRFPNAHLTTGSREDKKLLRQVIAYIETPADSLDLPLDIRGTAFQKRVWRAVREVPSGRTFTYAEIARKIGAPKAIRAVGSSCARNPLAFVIPCHRIIRSDGSTAWDRQRALLLREGTLKQKPASV
jgi:AraC family transcriptional regulator of adaptative response/methylated-DNA-[protein]-cysteine methyltransferase